jgi:hypothetical protein
MEVGAQLPPHAPVPIIGLGPGAALAPAIRVRSQECAESGREMTPAVGSSSAGGGVQGASGGSQAGVREGRDTTCHTAAPPPAAPSREPPLIGPHVRSGAAEFVGGEMAARSSISGVPSLETLRRAASSCSALCGEVSRVPPRRAGAAHALQQPVKDEPTDKNSEQGLPTDHPPPVTIPQRPPAGGYFEGDKANGYPPNVGPASKLSETLAQIGRTNHAGPCIPSLPSGGFGDPPGERQEACPPQGQGLASAFGPAAGKFATDNSRQWPPPLPSGKAEKLKAALLAASFAAGDADAVQERAMTHVSGETPSGAWKDAQDQQPTATPMSCGTHPGAQRKGQGRLEGPAVSKVKTAASPSPAKEASSSAGAEPPAFAGKTFALPVAGERASARGIGVGHEVGQEGAHQQPRFIIPRLPVRTIIPTRDPSATREGSVSRHEKEGTPQQPKLIIPPLPIAKIIPRLPIAAPRLPRAPRLPIARPSVAPSTATSSSVGPLAFQPVMSASRDAGVGGGTAVAGASPSPAPTPVARDAGGTSAGGPDEGPSLLAAATPAGRDAAMLRDAALVGSPYKGPSPCPGTRAALDAAGRGDAALAGHADSGVTPLLPPGDGVHAAAAVTGPAGRMPGASGWQQPWRELAMAMPLGGERESRGAGIEGAREGAREGNPGFSWSCPVLTPCKGPHHD